MTSSNLSNEKLNEEKPPRRGVNPDGVEGRLRSSFTDALREYMDETSLAGVRLAYHADTAKPLRHFCLFLMVMWLGGGLYVLMYFSYEYRQRPPLQVQLVDTPAKFQVHFPAVAICSNSIVSKKHLAAYSSYLYSRKENNINNTYSYTLSEIQENLAKFGALITFTTSDLEVLDFMQFLYNVDADFNITHLMYMLSPKCSSMLTLCKWRGRKLPCDQLFATRATPLGYCCLFNSRYQPEDINTPPKVLDLAGQNYGLVVAVLQNSDDFGVVRKPSTYGFAVLLFDGSEYPLMEGGAVRGYNVDANKSVFFQLSAHVQYATDEVKAFAADCKRGCHLSHPELPQTPRASYSWCLAECQRDTVAAVCNCRPFWYPPAPDPVCTPEHLYCLNKHREKFMYYFPGAVAGAASSLDEELRDSLDCAECAPDCARALHRAKVFHAAYHYVAKQYKPYGAKEQYKPANHSVLRFYYDSMSHHVYRVDLNFFWYEMMATTSCQALILLGVSAVSAAELVFHLTFRWAHHFVRRGRETTWHRGAVFRP